MGEVSGRGKGDCHRRPPPGGGSAWSAAGELRGQRGGRRSTRPERFDCWRMMGGRAVRCREESRGEGEREGGGFRLGAGSGRCGASSSARGHVFALPGSRISPQLNPGRRSCRRHLSLQLVHQATVVSRGSGLGAACRPSVRGGANGRPMSSASSRLGRARRPQRAGGGISGGPVWESRPFPGARAQRWRTSPDTRRARGHPLLIRCLSCVRALGGCKAVGNPHKN